MYTKLAFLSLLRRPLRHGVLFFLIAFASSLPVFILQLTGGLYNGINHAVEPFPILAGAKGSAYQLVLNTVFLKDKPIGNIPYAKVEELRQTGKAAAVYPLAFGDNYRGFRIVGIEEEIFSYQPKKNLPPWLSLKEGRSFQEEGDVVIGSETARLTGLALGDTFKSVHGVAGKGHEHEHPCRVTGILSPAGGPYDSAILTDIQDVWRTHGHNPLIYGKGDVTAILVSPAGYKEAMELLATYQRNRDMQMVFPSQSVISLYSMVGQSREFWQSIILALLAISILVTLLIMYWSGMNRMQEFALLRALGADRKHITGMLLREEALLLFFAASAGWCLAYGATLLTAGIIMHHSSIVMTTAPEPKGLLVIPLMTLIGTAAGIIPAGMIRSRDISRYL